LTIVVTGAGSGGHITPIQAVAAEIKRTHPKARIVYIGQKGDKLGDIPANDPNIDQVYTVRAGKFRRYHGAGFWQLLDLRTTFKNLRDFFYVLIGTFQSWRLLKELQPDVIFIKGGFVGVPVGLAAAKLHLKYITHDSDALPGLANRIIAKWATLHAVALPAEVYNYPKSKTVTTGIPLQANFVPVTGKLIQHYRKVLDLPAKAKVLFIIGGGLGAQNVNTAVSEAVPHLLREFPDLFVIHGAGRANEAGLKEAYSKSLSEAELARLEVHGYIKDVYRHSGAADIVITRAGATNLAEFALQGKACIVIPAPFLTGGHQLKNADYLARKGAALVLDQDDLLADPHRLAKQVSELLRNPSELDSLGKGLSQFAKPHATQELAKLITGEANEARP
jgi:UDP-N-acetylglucosamine--N-acetylmuramyl-(pentapeptide) pyrophosphoryl-undecaprenol N-acetylglucosamine transferase